MNALVLRRLLPAASRSVSKTALPSLFVGSSAATAVPARMNIAVRTFCAAETPTDIEARRKRLLWRSKCRGWLELDVLMGKFAEQNLGEFDDEKLDLFEEVLELENPDLFKWFTGQASVPAELLDANPVMADMLEFVKSDHGKGLNDK